jgi:TPR repeat protein
MAQLGRMLATGNGVTRDDVKAREWYERAVALSDSNAFLYLAELLDAGRGGAADRARAANLLLRAVRVGHEIAVREVEGVMGKWDRQTRIELKRLLQQAGHFRGELNDAWDGPARAAVTAYRAAAG